MERSEAIAQLSQLLKAVQAFNSAKATLEEAESRVATLKVSPDSKLASFDEAHKEAFVTEKIGTKPVPPPDLMKIAFPVYLVQKAIYDGAIAKYNQLLPLAEAAYREQYADERAAFAAEDKVEQAAALKEAESALVEAKTRFADASRCLEANDLLGEELKTEDTIQELLSYFTNRRADTIKEAVNLWFDEQRKNDEEERAAAFREEMKAMEEERVRAAQAAEEYAELQYLEAQSAAQYAKEAADSAKEAAENSQYHYNYSDISDNN